MAQPPRTRTRARMLRYFSLRTGARVEIASEPAAAATEGLAAVASSAKAARGSSNIESANSARQESARLRQIARSPAAMFAPRLFDVSRRYGPIVTSRG